MLVFRNLKMKEDEQFNKEIKFKLEQFEEAMPLYDTNKKLCAWKIQTHLNN